MSRSIRRILAGVSGLALFVAGAATSAALLQPATGSERAPVQLPAFARAVFLSHVNDPARTPLFPGDPAFNIRTVFTVPNDGFYLELIREGAHTGTHYSAPCHFHQGARCMDELSPSDLILPAAVIDIRDEVADLYPVEIFLKMFGLPLEREREYRALAKEQLASASPDPMMAMTMLRGIADVMLETVLDRRDHPQDDLISRMWASDIDGEPMTLDIMQSYCSIMFIAGLDTVTDSLSCFFAFLAQHDDHRRQIVEHPEIIPSAVEELLRWETPVPNVPRMTTTTGCPVEGHEIPAGSFVLVNVGAANVDPAEYDDPMAVRFDRDVNRHLAFGGGVHRCLGSHLARLELRVALREWHRRIPEYAVKDGHELVYTPAIRSLDTFPMVFTAR